MDERVMEWLWLSDCGMSGMDFRVQPITQDLHIEVYLAGYGPQEEDRKGINRLTYGEALELRDWLNRHITDDGWKD